MSRCDPTWWTRSPAFCPFAGNDCTSGCESNAARICIDGDDEPTPEPSPYHPSNRARVQQLDEEA